MKSKKGVETPEQREARYRKVRQPGVLETLRNGLMILRRYKHEWIPGLESMTRRQLKYETNRVRGSKFLPSWTLSRYVSWLEQKVMELNWNSQTIADTALFEEAQPVGYSNGRLVHKIRIELSSRCIHAYPVED
jgi:hypothetical protein